LPTSICPSASRIVSSTAVTGGRTSPSSSRTVIDWFENGYGRSRTLSNSKWAAASVGNHTTRAPISIAYSTAVGLKPPTNELRVIAG